METNFFHGNIKEILKYAMSLDTKSQKENYLKNIDKDIQKQLNFLDQSIRKEEVKRKSNLWGGRFSVSLRREDKILYKRLKGKILKLLTAIGENPSDRTDELLEQELQSLGQSMNNYSTNQVSSPFDHETQIVTPGFNLVEIPGMKERRERDWKTFYELHENDFV
ncbi:MAG: hypothetical protein FVQ80_18070, partial [Planctomycetes bacterium]|nr:hypothetical protein [Planctomycetota bacterium]